MVYDFFDFTGGKHKTNMTIYLIRISRSRSLRKSIFIIASIRVSNNDMATPCGLLLMIKVRSLLRGALLINYFILLN